MNHGRLKPALKLAIKTGVFLAVSLTAFYFYDTAPTTKHSSEIFEPRLISREEISGSLSNYILKNQFPNQIALGAGSASPLYKIGYTLDEEMQDYARQLLTNYKPDYAAIVLMNARTGEILTLSSFERHKKYDSNLALKASYPAASIFKVITAATAVDKAGVEPEQRIAFNGGNYTLYKKNVLSDKVNRWTRFITLKEAFARSINTAFGRLSLEKLNPLDLQDYANRFMFNQEIPTDFEVERSVASVPDEKGYELTEVASGYNRFNTLSPVHAALIASTIINEGKMPTPYLVKNIHNDKNELVYSGDNIHELDITRQIIAPNSAEKVKEMMEQTVLTGTSRKTFRQLVRDRNFRQIEMGGKTGHFTGTNPKGRTDWFVGYASDGDDRIAIAAITVNVEKWTVKSSALGEMMFRKYFNAKKEEKLAAAVEAKKLAEPAALTEN
ncbi:MAG: penicillin-binding protein transpeptidase protein [Pseudobdellovibrio sp.]|nr:penicillin-binding protein transpeptidase protein [Pseudobdellovibrio sp.]